MWNIFLSILHMKKLYLIIGKKLTYRILFYMFSVIYIAFSSNYSTSSSFTPE